MIERAAPAIVVGAGPAGLTAAHALLQRGIRPIVLERAPLVGGIARTEVYRGYRYDIGGHRFYTKVDEVQRLWQTMLGADFIQVPRLSRIYYDGHFFNYPLELPNTLTNLGVTESFRILLSYGKAQLWPLSDEMTFEQWVTNRFGRRLYRRFFKTYTEKVWGIPCNKIQAEWAAQRIKGLSLPVAVMNAVFGTGNTKSLINQFDYPVLGPGMMWERFRDTVTAGGGEVWLNTEVIALQRAGARIAGVQVRRDGQTTMLHGDHFISTMPLADLLGRLDPPPPAEVLAASRRLRYRAFVLAGLILRRARLFPDNWLYIHSPKVRVGRIQNFGNWSAALVPDPTTSSLGMEYFCDEGDEIWSLADGEHIALATRELVQLGLATPTDVVDGIVIRQPHAYPVYDTNYRACLAIMRPFLETIENLQTIGRNGMHRYNNQDHSMLTALLAVRNLFGERHDLWNVNTERSYYEEFSVEEQTPAAVRRKFV